MHRGPHVLVQMRLKVNWKLLIWPSLAMRFGLELNIYSLHMLRALHRFRCGGQHFTSQPLEWSLLFTPLTLFWLSLCYVNELGCVSGWELVNMIYTVLRSTPSSLSAQHQWHRLDVKTMTVLPVGNSFVAQSRGAKLQTMTCLLWRFISYVTLQFIRHGKCTI